MGSTGGGSCIAFYNSRLMELIALPAFEDNYFWLLHDGQEALVVDPGDAAPVTEALRRHGLRLTSILVTHHHGDHTGGVTELRGATGAQVFGPARERIPPPFTPLHGGDTVRALGITFRVIDVPGHTAGHIAYFADAVDGAPLLFCGDTLFSGGCGRIFEGTPAQMLASLDTLAALPADTRVGCAHEYTLSNLRFARAVEPGNTALAQYQQHCQALREGRIDAIANIDPVISLLEFRGELRVLADTRSLRGTQDFYGGPMPGSCLYARQDFVLRYPGTVQALTNAVVRSLKWLQTAGPSDIVRAVPEAYMYGDRAIYLAALDKAREAFSPDGLVSEEGVATAHRVVARFDSGPLAVRAAAPGATYTNDFVRRARQRYQAGLFAAVTRLG